jgi:hypothetical protein
VFETISGDAEFRRVRALAYVDLNQNFGGRLDSDWKPRPGDLRNVNFELNCRLPRRTGPRFADDKFGVSRFFLNEKLVLGFTCATERLNSQTAVTTRRFFIAMPRAN